MNARYPMQLPPTPCTLEMREKVLEVANSEGLSIAEVQRAAFSFFLLSLDRGSIKFNRVTIEEIER